MTNPTPEQLIKWKRLAAAATEGPWEADSTENEGNYGSGPYCHSGFSSYAVVAPSGRVCDTINSDVAMVSEEYDEDGCTAWDEVGKANMAFIAMSREAVPALIDEFERLTAENKRLRDKHFKSTVHNGISAEFLKIDEGRIAAAEAENVRLTAEREALKAECQTLRNGVIVDIAMTKDEADNAITLFYGETVRVIPVTITPDGE